MGHGENLRRLLSAPPIDGRRMTIQMSDLNGKAILVDHCAPIWAAVLRYPAIPGMMTWASAVRTKVVVGVGIRHALWHIRVFVVADCNFSLPSSVAVLLALVRRCRVC